jgi:hypothetical protein
VLLGRIVIPSSSITSALLGSTRMFPGVEEHHRQSGAVLAGLGEGLAACLGLRFVEPEGNRGSGQQVAHLVRPRGGGATDDSDGNVVGVLRGVSQAARNSLIPG